MTTPGILHNIPVPPYLENTVSLKKESKAQKACSRTTPIKSLILEDVKHDRIMVQVIIY